MHADQYLDRDKLFPLLCVQALRNRIGGTRSSELPSLRAVISTTLSLPAQGSGNRPPLERRVSVRILPGANSPFELEV